VVWVVRPEIYQYNYIMSVHNKHTWSPSPRRAITQPGKSQSDGVGRWKGQENHPSLPPRSPPSSALLSFVAGRRVATVFTVKLYTSAARRDAVFSSKALSPAFLIFRCYGPRVQVAATGLFQKVDRGSKTRNIHISCTLPRLQKRR
jgi:hypothetical protein